MPTDTDKTNLKPYYAGVPQLRVRRPGKERRTPEQLLQDRWYSLRSHAEQIRFWRSLSRFNIIHSGRRSGKTELAGKRKVVKRALLGSTYPGGGRYFAAAPTFNQAKRIFWNDLKLLTPKDMIESKPSETDLMIPLINGSQVWVLGLDKPERLEGSPWDHGCIDEIGNTKVNTWEEHVRPALSDRQGSCDFIGVPEGRNHYFDLTEKAKQIYKQDIRAGRIPRWAVFHWLSSSVLTPEEIAEAMEDMDELTYQQEYEGSFINFTGRAYYNYSEQMHEEPCFEYYNPHDDISFCFDFNVSPGVAAVVQEFQEYEGNVPIIGKTITGVIGEVFIKRNSNTPKVVKRLIQDWGNHQGRIFCYGDATGGSKGSAKVEGSDWDIISKLLRNHFGHARVFFKVQKQNPAERSRVNAVNSRLLATSGNVYMIVDPSKAPMVAKDFQGVMVKEDGTGEIDKDRKKYKMLTHLSDAIGYYVHFNYPVDGPLTSSIIQL